MHIKTMAYEARKAAQLIAALILKNGGRALNIVKVIKLVYIVDRESIKRCGFPALDEKRCSMRNGPVNSQTLDNINGQCRDRNGWSEFLTGRENHCVGLADSKISFDDLDELSDAEVSYINNVWDEFGHMGQWDLVDWTHDSNNIPEWEDPDGSSLTIPLERIMHAVGLQGSEEFLEIYKNLEATDKIFEEVRGV